MPGPGDVKPTDSYAEKLTKILPSEVTAVFLAIRSTVDLVGRSASEDGQNGYNNYVLFSVVIILTIFTPIFTKLTGHIQNIYLSIFIAFSFFIWSINIEYSGFISIAPNGTGVIFSYLVPILLILWAGLALPIYLVRSGR